MFGIVAAARAAVKRVFHSARRHRQDDDALSVPRYHADRFDLGQVLGLPQADGLEQVTAIARQMVGC